MTRIQILLALVAGSLFLLNPFSACVPDGTLPADDDTDTSDDDDTVADDDDNDTGTIVLSVDESMPTVQVVVSSLGSEERTPIECHTICTLTEVHAGRYLATAELDNALFVSVELEVVVEQTTAHTFAGGWASQGTYQKYDNPNGEGEPLTATEYEVTTEVGPLYDEWDVVHTRIPGLGDFEVEGNHLYLEDQLEGEVSPDLTWVKLNTTWWLVRQ